MSSDVTASSRMPELCVLVTTKMIIQGAVASRDWQPQHHDTAWATGQAGLPGIIMNNYTQAGWISRYVTDWCGARGRLGRMRFNMRSPICPGEEMRINGVVDNVARDEGIQWASLTIEMAVGTRIATTASVRVALPAADDAVSAWRRSGDEWRP